MTRCRCAFLAGALYAVTATSASAQSLPQMRLTQDLRIDATQHDLSPIGFVSVSPNGAIVASQPQDGHLRFFDQSGKPLGQFGRKGQGPGEFQNLLRAGWLGESLWLADGTTRRFTVLTPAREFARTVPWLNAPDHTGTGAAEIPKYSFLSPRALLAGDDQLIVASLSPDSPWPDGKQTAEPVIRTLASGRVRRVVTWRNPVDCLARGRSGEVVVTAILPFCAGPIDDVSADGSRYAVVEVSNITSRRGSFSVSLTGTDGTKLWSHTFPYEPAPISKQVVDSVFAQRTSRLPPNQIAAWKTITFPAYYPPISRVVVGRDVTTWLEAYSVSGERKWTTLDANGTVLRTVVVPRKVRLMVVSKDTVWAIDTDDDGLQHIVRFRVTR